MNITELAFRALDYHRLMDGERQIGSIYAANYPTSGIYQNLVDEDGNEHDHEKISAIYADGFDLAVAKGDTFAATEDMLSLAVYAARSFPDSWTYVPELMLSPAGVCYFAKPIIFDESTYKGIVWNQGNNPSDGTLIFGLTASPDGSNRSSFNGYMFDVGDGVEENDEPDTGVKFLVSVLELMRNRISQKERPFLIRSARRAMAAWRPVPNITVIRLRRALTKPHEDQGTEVDWSCRWLVRPHWRDQYYPSTDTHSAIWIAPYIKGPEDKPLRLTGATVSALVR